MALTRRGRQLTDVHRRRQIRLATSAGSDIRRAMRLLDPTDIDGTRSLWQARMVQIVQRYHSLSEQDAMAYLSRYRVAELGTVSGPVVVPGLDVAATASLADRAGPRGYLHRIGKGLPPEVAYQQMASMVNGELRKEILSGGRGVVRESTGADRRAVGWRRVSDGDPCTFCAMLVSRGPSYTSLALALTSTGENSAGRGWVGKNGNPDPYHNHCGCTVEAVYGDWEPTEVEQKFVDAYMDAAEAADAAAEPRTAQTVLWRMRENSEFRDSPARRRVNK